MKLLKQIYKFITSRLFLFAFSILVQIILVTLLVLLAGKYGYAFYAFFVILSTITLLVIVASDDNPVYKLAWVIPICLFPIFGWLLYFIGTTRFLSKKRNKKYKKIYDSTKMLTSQSPTILKEIEDSSSSMYKQANYIFSTCNMPIFKNTQTKYLSPGEDFFEALCEELKKAKHFIFMEYFIIQEGKMWDTILDILAQKVKEGVEVKVLYDDLGCIRTLPNHYDKKLKDLGINAVAFNPFKPTVDACLNYRDHRKITVIDGNVGFTGGNNLADEYINAYVKHGYWKDSSIIVKGEAVFGLTVLFLQAWLYYNDNDFSNDNFSEYRPTQQFETDGYVIPYGDGPLDGYLIGENIYMGLINSAKHSISITTPYLILDNEMLTALCHASISGVKVQIITPGVADKPYVFHVTRYNYKRLIEAGVEIYEMNGSFVHAKTIVCDDHTAVVGSQNFDFRSFYLHFECGILLYKTSTINDIIKDHHDIILKSRRYTLDDIKKKNVFTRILEVILNLFAPLM